ncbi:hypothetical protein P0D91_02745 [Pseudomonas sp. CBSPBW29]|jgi:hypothetical protein|uniref:hypothetical protein n=1 Tax=Pseudomonas TaxID=286 RepID=UPI0021AD4199|nr:MULTISPECIES: hypothetical protein [unclassified Pseudomonas]WEL43293.1 hypothetical protein P0D91_02745 [Pseudomonas sp. CBSPBW29]WEL64362.1 hypothetical protein P0D93_30315 [Pseudomonas sp. CBSPGW29]WEL73539.1 hypothetical protein P0D94_16220 [Pseudomonas sp. CBSPCGW29]WEL80904.1 hypothetical protein P0D95_23540 [Pseudomonas sp. CBSPCAW29]WEL89409.1 hypothetical protein P0D90_05860 [Pseudomonas sp. CBSPCBW29]
MAAVLVGQFHARDAEGRVYSVHEFQESNPPLDGLAGSAPTTTYKLAIGDRVEKLDGDDFRLIQSGTIITRESATIHAS